MEKAREHANVRSELNAHSENVAKQDPLARKPRYQPADAHVKAFDDFHIGP